MGKTMCGCLYHITSLLQVGVAVAIICIVAIQLQDVTYNDSDNTFTSTCSLGTAVDSSSLCVYAYAMAGISIGVSFVISLLQCCTCNLCGLGKLLDIIFSVVGTAWWVIGASVITTNVNDANGDPALESVDSWRTTVVILAWVEVGLFALSVIFGLGRCCGCGGSKGDDRV